MTALFVSFQKAHKREFPSLGKKEDRGSYILKENNINFVGNLLAGFKGQRQKMIVLFSTDPVHLPTGE